MALLQFYPREKKNELNYVFDRNVGSAARANLEICVTLVKSEAGGALSSTTDVRDQGDFSKTGGGEDFPETDREQDFDKTACYGDKDFAEKFRSWDISQTNLSKTYRGLHICDQNISSTNITQLYA